MLCSPRCIRCDLLFGQFGAAAYHVRSCACPSKAFGVQELGMIPRGSYVFPFCSIWWFVVFWTAQKGCTQEPWGLDVVGLACMVEVRASEAAMYGSGVLLGTLSPKPHWTLPRSGFREFGALGLWDFNVAGIGAPFNFAGFRGLGFRV